MSIRPVKPDIEISKRMIVVREYLRLTQEEMAKDADISQSMLAKIEKGSKELPANSIKALYLKHNISPNYLIAGVGDIQFKKEAKNQIPTVTDLKVDILIMQAEIEALKKELQNKEQPTD